MGHRRIGAVVGTPVSSTGEERLRGYVEALQMYGVTVEPELIRSGMPRILSGHDFAQELLALPQPQRRSLPAITC